MALEEESEEENAAAVAEFETAISQTDVADLTLQELQNQMPSEEKSKDNYAAVVAEFETALSQKDDEKLKEIIKSNAGLLHYSAKRDLLKVVKELLKHGANVCATNSASVTPLHVAAQYASKEVVSVLLQNGAIYDAVDDLETKAIDIAKYNEISKLLRSTESLFASVRTNNLAEVERDFKSGAILEAKNSQGITVLHDAAWKGFDKVVETLLGFSANVNVRSCEGLTPLHFAVRKSRVTTVKLLLFHGALFDAVDDSGKTPSDLCKKKVLSKLFMLIRACFQKIEDDDETVIDDISKIDCFYTKKAVLGARNNDGNTLTVEAIKQNFSKLNELIAKLQAGVHKDREAGLDLLRKGKFENALKMFKSAWKERLRLLGPDNLFTLKLQASIGIALEKLGRDQEALQIYQRIYEKQTEILGKRDIETTYTRMKFAYLTHGNKEDTEQMERMLSIRDDVCGVYVDHGKLMKKAFALELMQRYDEAFEIYESISTDCRRMLNGDECSKTLLAENFMGLIQFRQGKYKESIETLTGIFTSRVLMLGGNHSDTIKTLAEMDFIHAKVGALPNDADAVHKEILKHKLGVGLKLMEQGYALNALKLLREISTPLRAVFGGKSSRVRDCLFAISATNIAVELVEMNETEDLERNNAELWTAVIDSNCDALRDIFSRDGSPDVNAKDERGRTPLHFAVINGQLKIVEELLARGADVTIVYFLKDIIFLRNTIYSLE